jgi:hypothetical protein
MFYVCEWLWEIIFGVLNILKCFFVEFYESLFHDVERLFSTFWAFKKAIWTVAEVMFEVAMCHGVESPCEIIFCILGTEKSYLDEVA